MTSIHRYILQPGSKKHWCPDCGRKTFVLYLDIITSEPLPAQYGRCDREEKCGYYLNPYSNGYAKMISQQERGDFTNLWQPIKGINKCKPATNPAPSYIPYQMVKQSQTRYHQNNFVKWLTDVFGSEIIKPVIEQYQIGTSKYLFSSKDFPGYKSDPGATIFWQIDVHGKVRTGKIMLYDPTSGRRMKEPFNHITWAHKAMKLPEFELKQCYFGTHLLKDNIKSVALVESEKTAIIASLYLPEFIWLAVGSLSNLNADKCQILAGRKVCLFPDLNVFNNWDSKAKELSKLIPGTQFIVSDLLEVYASEVERQQSMDIADYLIKYDLGKFRDLPNEPTPTIINLEDQSPPEQLSSVEYLEKNANYASTQENYCTSSNKIPLKELDIDWNIIELESYFSGIQLTNQSVKLNQATTIVNVSLFLSGHLATVKANEGKRAFLPYLNRLQSLKQVLTSNRE
ncbi:DUF6965 family protein [Adhaeribacter radiodurans]|uniref:Toprim domain-containing protein n=1 Tax=Adhaeribacter radiodurans TaxID=2745197 RepID=A0A7L7L5N2_9BACT|nr:DUF6371 domain-containing protein [Adhaeribacter radiodurans]QMU28122.1 hypothetical protein HUW48_08710 [Adhaeribacter radiodurans]